MPHSLGQYENGAIGSSQFRAFSRKDLPELARRFPIPADELGEAARGPWASHRELIAAEAATGS